MAIEKNELCEIQSAIQMIIDQTGYGTVTIIIKDGVVYETATSLKLRRPGETKSSV